MSSDIIYRRLGKDGPQGERRSSVMWLATDGRNPVAALGFGAMGLTTFYGNRISNEEVHEVVKASVDEGCTLIATSIVSNPRTLVYACK
jgi:hypothetical protein